MIVLPTDDNIVRASKLLSNGQLVGMPTETVYGLAANAGDAIAVQRIFDAKNRPATNPLILHVANADDAESLIEFGDRDQLIDQWAIATTFWPGPLTVVVPRSAAVADSVTAGQNTVAIRVPNHPVALRLLQACRFPLAAPSANRSNYISPTTADHVDAGLGDRVAMILDGGRCECGLESTIIQLDEAGPRLLRPGTITADELSDRFGRPVVAVTPNASKLTNSPSGQTSPTIAPGMLLKHYSPSTPLRFADSQSDTNSVAQGRSSLRIGRISFSELPASNAEAFDRVWTLSSTGDLRQVASRLFAALREADSAKLDLILIDRCHEEGIGRAIMDRLRRATKA